PTVFIRRRRDDARQLQTRKRHCGPDRRRPHIACSPHRDTKHSNTLSAGFVMKVTEGQRRSSDCCQLRFWRPGQPLGYLAGGNCQEVLCVEVTERYSSGQLLVGNLDKSTQPQVAFSTRRKREPLQEQRP